MNLTEIMPTMLQARYKNQERKTVSGKLAFQFGDWENVQLIPEKLSKREQKELTESDWFTQYRLVPIMTCE